MSNTELLKCWFAVNDCIFPVCATEPVSNVWLTSEEVRALIEVNSCSCSDAVIVFLAILGDIDELKVNSQKDC